MFHTFTPRQWLFIIICYLQFCPTWPRGFTSSARTRVTASVQFLALTQSTVPNSLPYTQMLLGLYDTWTLIPYIHIGGWGGGITSQKSVCIDGQRPTHASTSTYSVERLLNKLEICLTHHVSTEEPLKRADMKPFSKELKQQRLKMIGQYTKTGPKQWLQHYNDLGTRKKKKMKKTKNHMEAHSWKGKGRSRMAIKEGSKVWKTVAANWDKWRASVQASQLYVPQGTKKIGEGWSARHTSCFAASWR